jgi:hypothetical protein
VRARAVRARGDDARVRQQHHVAAQECRRRRNAASLAFLCIVCSSSAHNCREVRRRSTRVRHCWCKKARCRHRLRLCLHRPPSSYHRHPCRARRCHVAVVATALLRQLCQPTRTHCRPYVERSRVHVDDGVASQVTKKKLPPLPPVPAASSTAAAAAPIASPRTAAATMSSVTHVSSMAPPVPAARVGGSFIRSPMPSMAVADVPSTPVAEDGAPSRLEISKPTEVVKNRDAVKVRVCVCS